MGKGETISNMRVKRVIVLSDNDVLFRAIEANLSRRLEVEVSRSLPDQAGSRGDQAEPGRVDLIVVAQSAQTGEPLAALAGASLAEWIGQVPVLTISEIPSEPGGDGSNVHLEFPFHPDELHARVRELLEEE
jgi:hypothetical protein